MKFVLKDDDKIISSAKTIDELSDCGLLPYVQRIV